MLMQIEWASKESGRQDEFGLITQLDLCEVNAQILRSFILMNREKLATSLQSTAV